MDKRTQVLDLLRQEVLNSDNAKKFAKEARKNMIDGIELAKYKWSNQLAGRIHKISRNP